MMKALRYTLIIGALAIASFAILTMPSKPAQAQTDGCTPVVCGLCFATVLPVELDEWITDTSGGTYWRMTRFVRSELTGMRVWMISIWWEDNVLPAMMLMTEQLTATAMLQMEAIGAFMDAKHQLETQQILQKIAARTHKDYQPSNGLCEIGSGAKALASSERKGEVNAVIMAQRSQDRALGAVSTAASIGESSDTESRVAQFRTDFCDPSDNNNGLTMLCDADQDPTTNGGNVGATNNERKNKDIDFVRTIDAPWTLDMDFVSNTTLTDNEEEVLALAANLYGEDVFLRPPPSGLTAPASGDTRINEMQKAYMDMRSVVAKRSVAENSYNAIAAMKSTGTPGSRDYLVKMMQELGITQADAERMLGENPSYYAQMEVLTKKLYHNPDFYTNLYDKPANVARKGVALQAIALMQKFDLFKSYLRNEASLSVLLELAVMDLQNEVENEMNPMTGEGEAAAP